MTRSRKGRRATEPEALSQLVRQVYPSQEPEHAAAIRAFAWWRRAVPERVFMRARPVRLSNGVLWVHTATSAWASELEHLKEQLLASAQKHAVDASVKSLRFRVGPLPELPTGTRPERPRQAPVAVAILPEALARALAAIDDDALRDAIGQAASVTLGRDAARSQKRENPR
ncbi:MAG: DUF721 domain-containing protein [Myxococcales bacterium]